MREHVLRELHLLRLVHGDRRQLRRHRLQVQHQHLPDAARLQHLHHHRTLDRLHEHRPADLRQRDRAGQRGQLGLPVSHRLGFKRRYHFQGQKNIRMTFD